jgi:predicted  nucleic acid-binding Zn-ribbon protein
MPFHDTQILEKLLTVQEMDLRIRELTETWNELQDRCMREDTELNALTAQHSEILSSQTAMKAQREMYQTTLDDIRTAIKGLQANRTRAFKPRNRSSTEALRTEEEKLSVLIVEMDEQLTTLRTTTVKIEEAIAVRTEQVRILQQAPEARIKKLRTEIDQIQVERDGAVQDIPGSLLRKYDRLRHSRSGIGLTILQDGVCSVCRMELPTGIRSRVLNDEGISACPACGRMVVRIENSITYRKMADQARIEQEKRMRDEEEAARREEEEENRKAMIERENARKQAARTKATVKANLQKAAMKSSMEKQRSDKAVVGKSDRIAKKPAPAAKKAVAKKPAPAAKKPVTKKPAPAAKKPVTKKPAPAAKKAVAKKPAPAAKKPVAKKPAPAAKKAVTKKPAPAAKKPVAKKPAPAAKKAVTKKPAPAAKKPVAKKPAPAAKKPVAKKPAPAAKKAVAKKPVAKKPAPAAKKPVAKKPVAKKPVSRR